MMEEGEPVRPSLVVGEGGDGGEGGKREEVRQYMYIGETCRSAYERGREHMGDIKQLKPSSHLLKHLIDQHEHEEWDKVDIRMETIVFSRSAFERQIMEAVQIQHNRHHHLLNSRAEFNRSAIPRLGMKLGDREFKDKGERDKDEKEETLEAKIRAMRRDRNKERGSKRQTGEPKRKRRKKNPESENEQSADPPTTPGTRHIFPMINNVEKRRGKRQHP